MPDLPAAPAKPAVPKKKTRRLSSRELLAQHTGQKGAAAADVHGNRSQRNVRANTAGSVEMDAAEATMSKW